MSRSEKKKRLSLFEVFVSFHYSVTILDTLKKRVLSLEKKTVLRYTFLKSNQEDIIGLVPQFVIFVRINTSLIKKTRSSTTKKDTK